MPIVSKEEHLQGWLERALTLRSGEPIAVRLKSITWRQIKDLSTRVIEKQLDHSEELVYASLPEEHRGILDKLDSDSASLLQKTAQVLNMGESTIKNVPELIAAGWPWEVVRGFSAPQLALYVEQLERSRARQRHLDLRIALSGHCGGETAMTLFRELEAYMNNGDAVESVLTS